MLLRGLGRLTLGGFGVRPMVGDGRWAIGLAASWGAWLVTPQCRDSRGVIGAVVVIVWECCGGLRAK
jgi:hypothetical protein